MLPAKFSELVTSLAAGAVVSQCQLNREFEIASQRYLATLASLPPVLTALLSCPPVRYSVNQFDIGATLLLTVDRARGVELRVAPVNLGYCVRHQTQAEHWSRFQVHVEQVPVAKGASFDGQRQQALPGSQ